MIREQWEKLTRQKTMVAQTPEPTWTVENHRVQGAAGTDRVEYHDGSASEKWREFEMNNNTLNSGRRILEEVWQEQCPGEKREKIAVPSERQLR